MEDFPHYVTQINCLTGAINSKTYIRHILRMNIFNDYTILHRSPPRLHLHEVAGWTVGGAGILGGRPREAAPAGDTGPRPVCGGEVEGPHECVEGRTRGGNGRTEGSEGCSKAARPTRRRRGPHTGAEGRTRDGNGRTEGSEGCTKAARPARRRRGPPGLGLHRQARRDCHWYAGEGLDPLRLRVRRPPGSGSASGSQTGVGIAHAAAGFGFGFGFANRRCGSARRRRVRVRKPAVRKRTPPPGSCSHRQASRKCHWSAGEGLDPLRETSGPRGVSHLC